MREITGEFETHFTVTAAASDVALLRVTAERLGMKWLLIELDRGEARSQPMLTASARGRLSDVLPSVRRQAANLVAAGLSVVRVKIEAAPSALGIPQTSAEVQLEPAERYFEHHVKLLLSANADLRPLVALAQQDSAHLSRNARRQRSDGLQERFVTQRCQGMCQAEARSAWQRLLTDLRAAGYEILETEEEYVVYDSNLALDAGWLSGG